MSDGDLLMLPAAFVRHAMSDGDLLMLLAVFGGSGLVGWAIGWYLNE